MFLPIRFRSKILFLWSGRRSVLATSKMLSLIPTTLKVVNARINYRQPNYTTGMLVQKSLELYHITSSMTLRICHSLLLESLVFLYIYGKECFCTISYQVAWIFDEGEGAIDFCWYVVECECPLLLNPSPQCRDSENSKVRISYCCYILL